MRRAAASICAAAALFSGLASPRLARAGYFDVSGNFIHDPNAAAVLDFETTPDRYLPDGQDMSCTDPAFVLTNGKDALSGESFVTVKVPGPQCAERFLFTLPPGPDGSYVARVWARHGAIDMSIFALHVAGSGVADVSANFSATGRTTTDGWVEYETNEFPVATKDLDKTYLKVSDYASVAGVDVDALELVPSGQFVSPTTCAGLSDPACSSEEVCISGQCALARLAMPTLPDVALKDATVDFLESRLKLFYGGRFSRATYLPNAIARMEAMRSATTAWEFWGGFAAAIHDLHDWHTDTFGGLDLYEAPAHRLNACFFEADADLSHVDYPRDALYPDIVVSHSGAPDTAMGLAPGDRLLAIDGVHPLAWAASLGASNWDYHVATDPAVFADFAEALGGPSYFGGSALIIKYAKTITILRCSAATRTCATTPETIEVASIPFTQGDGNDVQCDNRPYYHLGAAGPDPTRHSLRGRVYSGQIVEAADAEKIYSMVWDSLDGQGSASSPLNTALLAAIADYKANAKGVILDHRAGNGGTLDSATYMTGLVRPPSIAAVLRIPIEVAGDDGPADLAAGQSLFTQLSTTAPYNVGDADWAKTLPVALVLHRDGSASDYMPFGIKGAPNVRVFAPHQTAGAFSTYISYGSSSIFGFQVASGDTIAADGHTLIGTGVPPDESVYPKQSDLLRGHDTVFDAALAWLRTQQGGP